jgi:hypothetical protein
MSTINMHVPKLWEDRDMLRERVSHYSRKSMDQEALRLQEEKIKQRQAAKAKTRWFIE